MSGYKIDISEVFRKFLEMNVVNKLCIALEVLCNKIKLISVAFSYEYFEVPPKIKQI